MRKIKKKIITIIKFIYPPLCIYCHKSINDYNSLCINCNKILIFSPKIACSTCEINLTNNNILRQIINGKYYCNNCITFPPFFTAIKTYLVYDKIISSLIFDFKYKDNTTRLKLLGDMLIKSYKNAWFYGSIDVIIPIPISYLKLIKRKYNQTALLSKYLSQNIKVTYRVNILQKKKHNKAQAQLNLHQRLTNIKDVFKLNNKYKNIIYNKNILLVDDIITTGNTVNEAAKILKNNGAKQVFVVAISRVAGELKVYYNN
ncbi:ComF family protein [Rickettsiales bacterium LUAb2]